MSQFNRRIFYNVPGISTGLTPGRLIFLTLTLNTPTGPTVPVSVVNRPPLNFYPQTVVSVPRFSKTRQEP